MQTNIFISIAMFCIVNVNSENGSSHKMPEYVRIKRAKYYSGPPLRIYRSPPSLPPVKGVFSYTPPPNYMDSEDPPYPSTYKSYKVSKRPPSTDGLPDKDINNLVKHISKEDLNKIIELAGEKFKQNSFENSHPYIDAGPKSSFGGPRVRDDDNSPRRDIGQGDFKQYAPKIEDSPEFVYKGPYAPSFKSKPIYVEENIRKPNSNTLQTLRNSSPDHSLQIAQQESLKDNQFSFVEMYIQKDLHNSHDNNVKELNDNKVIAEEQLPRPSNLREDDYYVGSDTNNVPSIHTNSYKVENFGDLPLMGYHSKLDSVSSYHVPHYSVISPPPQSSPSESSSSLLLPSPSAANINAPRVEVAPPRSAAREQSDAHLKAIKIWTHHSRGTAYTLHDDGTLSLERPLQPKPFYGYQ